MQQKQIALAAPVLAALILTACGGSEEGGSTASSTKAVSGSVISSPETLASADAAQSGSTQDSRAGSLQTKAIISGTHSLTSGTINRLYGPGVYNQDALANTIVGGPNNQKVSNRFRAQHNGHITSVRLYWQPGRGYSSGNGGTIRLRIMPDAGGLPNLNAAALATGYYSPGGAAYGSKPIFADAHLTSSGNVQAGQIYHLVLENVDGSPTYNYISSNNAITIGANGRPSRWVAPSDWATLLNTRGRWLDLTTNPSSSNNYYVPILQLNYSTGAVQGNSNMEGGATDPKQVFTANANQPVREQFRPSSTRQVSGLSVATSASVGGQLLWRIVENGNELASGTISQWSPNYSQVANRSGNRVTNYQWYDINLPRTITFRAGSTYDVEFLPQGSSQWKFADQRTGADFGFRWPAAFTESQAQHRRGGRWINAYHWDYNQNRGGSNWPVVLHLN